jgi:hypothetical protein
MNDSDDYIRVFAAQALDMLLGVLSTVRPGRLREFTIRRDDAGDSFGCSFELDARPGVEFVYYQGIRDNGPEPLMSPESAVSIVFGAIVERTAMGRPAVDGRVDLMLA